MRLRRNWIALGSLAVLVPGALFAQTIFTRNFPINGNYAISLPASPNPSLTNAEQLRAYGPFATVSRYRTQTDAFVTWNGSTCTPAIDPDAAGVCATSCFCVIPGEAYLVSVGGAPQNWNITGFDGVTTWPLTAPGAGSLSGRHLVSMPIVIPPLATSLDLMNSIGGGSITPVASVARYDTPTSTFAPYTGRMASPNPIFNLVQGEGYLVQMNSSVSYTPPQPGTAFTNPCIAPDANGTINLPPACGYLSPNDVHVVLNGLPPGTRVNIGVSHQGFINIQNSLSLQTQATNESFDSDLVMHVTGTGVLAGVDCMLTMTGVHVAVLSQPPQVGQALQDFDTDMVSMTGSLVSDNTCNLFQNLNVLAGTANGLYSPGHVRLKRRLDGTFDVNSYFDVQTTISFVGKPGSLLAGMSGSTTKIVRMGTPSNLGVPTPVPTLPTWGLIVVIALVGTIGAWVLWRRSI